MDRNPSGMDGSTGAKPMHLTPKQESQARAIVSKLSRADLEDKYLGSQEEAILLKRHVRKQEDKIKRISTKLIRLVNDRKKWSSESGHGGARTTREVSLEEKIETQQDAIRKFQKDNDLLKQKYADEIRVISDDLTCPSFQLHVANQQIMTQGRRHTPYGHVQSRVNSGVERRPFSARDRPRSGVRSKSPGQDRYGHSLLEEARDENHKMRDTILGLQEQVANMERERNVMQHQLRLKNAEHEGDVLKFKEEMNSTKKNTLSENIDLIRLQREIKEKSDSYQSMEARYRELQDNHQAVRTNYEKVLHELDALKTKLFEEEKRTFALQNRLKHESRGDPKAAEMKHIISDLEKEVEILKEANERLTHNALTAGQEQKWRKTEMEYKRQIAQLEHVVQHDLKDKDSVLQRAASERAMKDRMHDETRRLHEECVRLRTENDDLRNRMRLVTSLDDAVEASELEEALSVIRQKRHLASERKRPDFLEEEHETKDVDELYNDLQVQHADTIQELEKTREMLLMQHRINKDYQIEVDSVSSKMEEMKREYESRLEHYAQLLDARAARVKKLEKQLHDVAYGTKQFKINKDEDEMDVEEEDFDITRLERGENLLEINIQKATLSHDALQALGDREPSTFVTYEFYDYEIVSTPIIKSGSPRFDFTSQYIVRVDDLFLYHLQKNSTRIELHQAFGTDYTTICGCSIRLNHLLDKPQGKLHGSAILTGARDGANYGTLDFWVRLRVPMDQAIRLYKERTKALGYLSANSTDTQKKLDTPLTLQQQDANFNQMELRLMSCNHVQARRPGVQPDIYCVYKFYDFGDHDTVIIPNTNNPHFDDVQYFPVQMTADLDAYIKSEKLEIYVFDDGDSDMTSYLGKATVDMIPLAHDKVIKAPFQLYSPEDTENGTVEISLRWKLPYRAPAKVMRIPETETEKLEKLHKQEDQMVPEKLVPHIAKPKRNGQKQTKVVKKTAQPKPTSPETTKPQTVKQTMPKTTSTKSDPVIEPQNTESTTKEKPFQFEVTSPDLSELKQTGTLETEDASPREDVNIPEVKMVKPAPTHPLSDEDDIEEDIEEEIDEGSALEQDETDSETFIMSSPEKTIDTTDTIRITVNHLTLNPDSWVYKDPDIQKIFVEYTFLRDVEETPVSLPEPKNPSREMSYNFSKVTHVDAAKNEEKRNHLAAMILPTAEVDSRISFTVVSEPTNDEDECDELGSADVDLKAILNNRQDVVDTDLEVVSGNSDKAVIGRINVSVEALGALESLVKEVNDLLEKSIGK